MSEQSVEKINPKNEAILSRRSFLKKVGKYAIAGLTLATGLPPDTLPTSPAIHFQAREKGFPVKRSELPSDILSEEELKRNNITIYQTADIQLHLRREALKLPILKDAIEGKINGVVISLVDSETLGWKHTAKLPEDAKAVWQATHPHPSEYTEEEWQEMTKGEQQSIKHHQDHIKSLQEKLGQGNNKEQRDRIINELMEAHKSLQESQLMMEILQDRQKAIDYFSENWIGKGQYLLITREFFEKEYLYLKNYPQAYQRALAITEHPEFSNKAYIYLSVKGESAPDPTLSFPNIDMFLKNQDPNRDLNSYTVLPKQIPGSTGFSLRHEVAHYVAGKMEGIADELALEQIEEAWKKYQETGDSSKYAFVFINKKGVTITKAPETTGVPV